MARRRLAFNKSNHSNLFVNQYSFGIGSWKLYGSRFNGAFAEFERSIIQQRVKLGLKRAVAQGKKLGRPAIASDLERKA